MMKGTFVILTLLIATALATWRFHRHAQKAQTEIDKINVALSAIKKILPPNANITFQPVNIQNEIYLWTRYVLTPQYIAPPGYEQYKNVLTISPIANMDSARSLNAGNRIWETQDDMYYYSLTQDTSNDKH